jgi:YHS domain-containing protein
MGGFLFEILDFLVLAMVVVGMLRKVASLFRATRVDVRTTGGARPGPAAASGHHAEMARDPVCGMFVSTELPYQLRQGGETVHFCSDDCLKKFRKEPSRAAS